MKVESTAKRYEGGLLMALAWVIGREKTDEIEDDKTQWKARQAHNDWRVAKKPSACIGTCQFAAAAELDTGSSMVDLPMARKIDDCFWSLGTQQQADEFAVGCRWGSARRDQLVPLGNGRVGWGYIAKPAGVNITMPP